jgi:hypothetical protein
VRLCGLRGWLCLVHRYLTSTDCPQPSEDRRRQLSSTRPRRSCSLPDNNSAPGFYHMTSTCCIKGNSYRTRQRKGCRSTAQKARLVPRHTEALTRTWFGSWPQHTLRAIGDWCVHNSGVVDLVSGYVTRRVAAAKGCIDRTKKAAGAQIVRGERPTPFDSAAMVTTMRDT